MITRIRTLPVLACLAVLALSMPCDAEAGFGLFKRFKKRTACCPKPTVTCCPTRVECDIAPPLEDVKVVTGKVCFEFGGMFFFVTGDPCTTETFPGATCEQLVAHSCATVDLIEGATVLAELCYEANGCDDEDGFVCPEDCPDMVTGVATTTEYAATCVGCCSGHRIVGPQITGSDRNAVMRVARLFMLKKAETQCCGCCITRLCYTVKVVK